MQADRAEALRSAAGQSIPIAYISNASTPGKGYLGICLDVDLVLQLLDDPHDELATQKRIRRKPSIPVSFQRKCE